MKIITRQEAKEQNLSRYYTGKPCRRGHDCESYTKTGKCTRCKALHDKKQRNASKSALIARRDECAKKAEARWSTAERKAWHKEQKRLDPSHDDTLSMEFHLIIAYTRGLIDKPW